MPLAVMQILALPAQRERQIGVMVGVQVLLYQHLLLVVRVVQV